MRKVLLNLTVLWFPFNSISIFNLTHALPKSAFSLTEMQIVKKIFAVVCLCLLFINVRFLTGNKIINLILGAPSGSQWNIVENPCTSNHKRYVYRISSLTCVLMTSFLAIT